MIMTHDTSNNKSNSVCGTKTCLQKSANPSFTNFDKKQRYIYIYYNIYIYMHSDHLITSNHPYGFSMDLPDSSQWPIGSTEKRQLQLRHVRLVRHHLGQTFQLVLAQRARLGDGQRKFRGVWGMSLILMKMLGYMGWWWRYDHGWWIIWWIIWWIYDTWRCQCFFLCFRRVSTSGSDHPKMGRKKEDVLDRNHMDLQSSSIFSWDFPSYP